MKLYLVRHGIAVDHIGGHIKSDAERPLTSEGKEETAKVAAGIKKIGAKPNILLSSPLVRARQTAEIFAEVFHLDAHIEISDALAPAGDHDKLFKKISSLGLVQEVMLFGHQPDMTILAQRLLWAGSEADIPFKKAGVCRIDVYDLPPTSPGTLKWMLPPKISTALAK